MPHSVEYYAGTTYYTNASPWLSVCLFNTSPKMYFFMCILSFRMYIKHGSPVKMMEGYIAVLTKGICQSDENGSFLIKDYDVRKAYLAGSVKG